MYRMINNIRFIKSFDLPGTELFVLHLLSHLILKMTIWDKFIIPILQMGKYKYRELR